MAVRFKLDESLPRDAAAFLHNAGHEIQTALEERLGGRADSPILDACRKDRRILVTLDHRKIEETEGTRALRFHPIRSRSPLI